MEWKSIFLNSFYSFFFISLKIYTIFFSLSFFKKKYSHSHFIIIIIKQRELKKETTKEKYGGDKCIENGDEEDEGED